MTMIAAKNIKRGRPKQNNYPVEIIIKRKWFLGLCWVIIGVCVLFLISTIF